MIRQKLYTPPLAVPISANDHCRGPARASVVLVEYGDYECPECGVTESVVTALRETMGDRFRFVYRHFPLSTVHPHANDVALAAEAAATQGRFWEMHDVVYGNQNALELHDLMRYAASLGLDLERFETDFQSNAVWQRVQRDFLGGARSGVNATPTFFINGIRHNGIHDFESLATVLEQARDQSK